MFSNNPITNRTITNWGKGRRVMGVNPLTITPLCLPLDPIAPSRPYTSMGLCWCGVTRHPNHQPAPPATGWLPPILSWGCLVGGSPSPCTHGENHVKTLLRGSGGGVARWGGCGVDGGWRRGSRRGEGEGGREGKGNIFLSGWGCAGSVGEGGAGWCCLAMGQGLHPMQLVSRWVLSGGFPMR